MVKLSTILMAPVEGKATASTGASELPGPMSKTPSGPSVLSLTWCR